MLKDVLLPVRLADNWTRREVVEKANLGSSFAHLRAPGIALVPPVGNARQGVRAESGCLHR